MFRLIIRVASQDLFLLLFLTGVVFVFFQALACLDPLHLRIRQLHKLEGFLVLLSDVVAILQAVQVELEVEHLFVMFILIEADDGYTVVKLESEGVDRVINENDIRQLSLVEDAQVLHIEVRSASPHTTGTIETSLDEVTFGVEVVDDRVSILLFGCSEYYNLEVLVGCLEAVNCVGADIDAGEDRVWVL